MTLKFQILRFKQWAYAIHFIYLIGGKSISTCLCHEGKDHFWPNSELVRDLFTLRQVAGLVSKQTEESATYVERVILKMRFIFSVFVASLYMSLLKSLGFFCNLVIMDKFIYLMHYNACSGEGAKYLDCALNILKYILCDSLL